MTLGIDRTAEFESLTDGPDERACRRPELEVSHTIEAARQVDGLAICHVVGFQNALPLLAFEIDGTAITALPVAVACDLGSLEIGTTLCVCFDQQRCDRPVVIGKLVCDISRRLASANGIEILDDKQITLRCGKASISLKSDGTVAIRGTNVASRASHTNRIRGGNVQIN